MVLYTVRAVLAKIEKLRKGNNVGAAIGARQSVISTIEGIFQYPEFYELLQIIKICAGHKEQLVQRRFCRCPLLFA